MPFSHDHVRLLLDEDTPGGLDEALRARGYLCEAMHDPQVRERIYERRPAGAPRGGSIPDPEVAEEASRCPTVLVTMNLRDYSDPHQHAELVEKHGISVVQVRVPKREFSAKKRPAAVCDIVHRWAHRMVGLADDAPHIVTANRGGLRARTLDDIRAEREQRERKNAERRNEIAAHRAEDQTRRERRQTEQPARPKRRRAETRHAPEAPTLFDSDEDTADR